MTLPIYSRKLHFFTPSKHGRGQAMPSLCPQFYHSFMSKTVRNPSDKDKCKTCRNKLEAIAEARNG
jgi:hypothetical protein